MHIFFYIKSNFVKIIFIKLKLKSERYMQYNQDFEINVYLYLIYFSCYL